MQITGNGSRQEALAWSGDIRNLLKQRDDDAAVDGVDSPPSKTVIATTRNTFEFWDIASRKITASLPIDGPTFMAFSPDGTMMATVGNDGRIRLWDMPGGTPADRKCAK